MPFCPDGPVAPVEHPQLYRGIENVIMSNTIKSSCKIQVMTERQKFSAVPGCPGAPFSPFIGAD